MTLTLLFRLYPILKFPTFDLENTETERIEDDLSWTLFAVITAADRISLRSFLSEDNALRENGEVFEGKGSYIKDKYKKMSQEKTYASQRKRKRHGSGSFKKRRKAH